MRTKKLSSHLNQVLAAVLTIVALATGLPAKADGYFTIYEPTFSGSKAKFRVTRGGYQFAQTVYYRTISITAYPGQHYTELSGKLEFDVGEMEKAVYVEEMTPTSNAYKYQNGITERSYKLEVTNLQGLTLAEQTRTITNCGTSVDPSTAFVAHDYFIHEGSFMVYDKGFDSDKNPPRTRNCSDFFDATAPSGYLTAAGSEVRATFSFDVWETEDGYQHFQVLTDNTSTCDTDNDNVYCGTPNLSRYLVSFAHDPGTQDDIPMNYTFPLTQYGEFTDGNGGPIDNPWGSRPGHPSRVYSQKFNTNCRASDGKLILPNDFKTLVLRFDASGNFGDDWHAEKVKAYLQNVDAYAPRKIAITANPGRHAKGNTVYVSVAFNEPVTVTGTPTLETSWGTLDYVAGDNTNVLTFSGRITDDASSKLNVLRIINADIRDLKGNLAGLIFNATNIATIDADLTYELSDFQRDDNGNYLIITHDDLYGLASYAKTHSTVGLSFLQVSNLYFPYDSDKLTDNDYTFENFIGISNFQGTYDGGGKEITWLRMYRSGTNSESCNIGLFRKIGQGGVVRNVKLIRCYFAGYQNVGGIAGSVSGGTIEDCIYTWSNIHALQENSSCHGLIAGSLTEATIRRCYITYSAKLTKTSDLSNCSNFGGIAGYAGSGATIADNIAEGVTIHSVKGRGVIAGCLLNDATLSNNYYHSCNVAGTSNAKNVGIGTEGSTVTADRDGARKVYTVTLANYTSFDRTLSATLPSDDSKTYPKTYNNGADIGKKIYAYASAPLHLTYDSSKITEGNAFALDITRDDTDKSIQFTDNDDYTYDFTMPEAAITVTTTQAEGISYIDKAGRERWLFLSDCVKVYGNNGNGGTYPYEGEEKWFYVPAGEYNFMCINIIAKQANIIFCDGVVINFAMQPQGIFNRTLKSEVGYVGGGIAIYGQKKSNAKINIQNGQGGTIEALGDIEINGCDITVEDFDFDWGIFSDKGDITIRRGNIIAHGSKAAIFARNDVNILGGTVQATCSDKVYATTAIYAQGNVNIIGGDVTAIGGGSFPGIKAGYNGDKAITLGWTNPSDRITANSFACGTLNVSDGQTLTTNSGATYSGTLTDNQISAIGGKTLMPATTVTFAKEGYATAYYGDYDLVLPTGMKARIVTDNNSGTLNYKTIADGSTANNTVPAATPVMLQVAATSANQTLGVAFDEPQANAITDANYLHGSDTDTATDNDACYAVSPATDAKYYKLSYNQSGEDIGWYWGTDNGQAFTSGAHKVWLMLPGTVNAQSFFGLSDFEDSTPTGMKHETLNMEHGDSVWYTLDGRKLNAKPTQKGLYINNGKKVLLP